MSLVGKTTIKLFDDKTGELSDIVESNNMVTNAVSNIFNGFLNAVALSDNNGVGEHNSLNYLFDIPDGYNLAKTFFGGLLIFSSAIKKDVNHIIPTIDEMKTFIGCGNQGSSITGNTFKGNFNSAESVIGDNYVTFVWGFTTEQCNGDIASICLTSDIGGCEGYKINVKSSKYDAHFLSWLYDGMWNASVASEYNSAHIHNPMFKSSFTNSNAHGMYIYENNFYYVYRDKVYKYNIDKILHKNGSDILSNFNIGVVSSYDEVITLTSYSYSVFDCLDGNKVYEFDNNQSDKSKLTLIKVSKNAVTETIEIPTTNIISSMTDYFGYNRAYKFLSSNSCIYKDKIYTIVGWINQKDLNVKPNKLRLYILSFDGSFTFKDLNLTDNMISMLFGTKSYNGSTTESGLKFLRIFNNLILQSSDGTNGYVYYLVSNDGDVDEYPFMHTKDSLYSYGNILYKNSGLFKEPWCSFKFCNNGIVNSIEMVAPYLATINNQDVVLTKTADKTMKIIYTLTQE